MKYFESIDDIKNASVEEISKVDEIPVNVAQDIYDFFNNGLYDIRIDEDFTYDLDIPFDNSAFMEIFKKKVQENGFDYLTVRIYEASLFISMPNSSRIL